MQPRIRPAPKPSLKSPYATLPMLPCQVWMPEHTHDGTVVLSCQVRRRAGKHGHGASGHNWPGAATFSVLRLVLCSREHADACESFRKAPSLHVGHVSYFAPHISRIGASLRCGWRRRPPGAIPMRLRAIPFFDRCDEAHSHGGHWSCVLDFGGALLPIGSQCS